MMRLFVAFLVLTFTCCTFPLNHTEQINRLIVFGDSLSDNGNDYLLTQQMHKLTHHIPIIPAPEIYWNGRFSDGPVWADYLAGIFQFMPDTFTAEQRASRHYQNFAYGGAWAETLQPDKIKIKKVNRHWHLFPLPLSAQVEDYLLRNKLNNPKNYQTILHHDLIIVWIGGNDYLNQELSGTPISRPPNSSTDIVMAAIRTNLIHLIQAGASHFILFGLPDLSKVPNIYLRDPKNQSLAPNLATTSLLHNQKLQQLTSELSQKYPTSTFTFLDLKQIFDEESIAANERAQNYQTIHNGHYQKTSTPCVLEANDPDPTLMQFLKFNPLLAMTIPATHHRQTSLLEHYRQCDAKKAEDQKSPFNFSEDYWAGGMFFDHVHPLTHMHAKIALAVCQTIKLQGYQLLHSSSSQYEEISCDHFSVMTLVHRIIHPPFPLE